MEKDKSFLGTKPVGKLLLQLALPTVAAQLINMLYNIVDRIYIGHIPGEGALALTGVGVCMPLIMVVSAFAALVGNGGAPRASIFMGKNDTSKAELLHHADHHLPDLDCYPVSRKPQLSPCIRRQRKHHRLCSGLHEYLCSRNYLCTADSWHE